MHELWHQDDAEQIFVKNLDGKHVTLRIKTTTTIDTAKLVLFNHPKVQAQLPDSVVSPDEVRLIFAGKHLENHKTLLDYSIAKEDTIHMVLRLRGGAPKSI